MAAPNIVNVTTITGKTTYNTPANTAATVLLANSSSSNKVFKINMIIASNIDTAAANATVSINSLASGSGTSYQLISTASVPANASLIAIDKSTAFYLEEDKSIIVTSGTASKLVFTVSYEEIS